MKKKILSGIAILAFSSFIIKVLGFVTRVYMSNVMGAEGTGVYQLVLSVYAVGASFAVSGISAAVCTLCGAKPSASHKIVKSGLLITLVTGLSASLFCFFFASDIAGMTGDMRAENSIRLISVCFPFASVFACLSGYFNGRSQVKFPVMGQVVEQASRIALVFLFLRKAMDKGIVSGCLAASFGICAGEIISAVYLFAVFLKKRTYGKNGKSYKRKLLSLSIPAALGGYFNSVMHTAENILIPVMLSFCGYSHSKAVGTLGIIKGMAAPIAYFPNIIVSAVTTVILPAVSYAAEHGRMNKIRNSSEGLFRISFFAGGFFASFFCSFGEEICMVLYHNIQAGRILSLYGLITPFLYVNMVSASILYGAGRQNKSLLINISEGLLRIILIVLFVPVYGIYGYMAAVILSDVFAAVFNINAIGRLCKCSFPGCKYFVSAAIAFVVSVTFGNSLFGIYRYPGVVFSYILTMILLKTVKISDLKWLKYNIFSK